MVVTAQQLRMRDCHNVEVMLFSQTQPVIESSTGITFVCHQVCLTCLFLQYSYPELAVQMKAAKLSYWNNKWTDIFDFTTNKGGKANYSLNFGRQSSFVTLAQM